MNEKNTEPSLIIRNIIYLSILGGTLGFTLILIWAQLTGHGPISKDARFVEFRVCLDKDNYQPTDIVALGEKVIYICGVIEGKGILQGVLHIYQDDRLIYSRLFDNFAGTYFEEVYFKDGVGEGRYTVDIFYAKQVIAKTHFTVVESE